MTDEQYNAEKNRILADERYTPALKNWMIVELDKMYKDPNYDPAKNNTENE
jgi:hypothetical protein